jgi:phage tail sheath gpL-like
MVASTAIDPTQISRATAVKTEYKQIGSAPVQFLPQHVGLVAQGNDASTYALTKFRAFSALEVAEALGYGSPAHLAALELLPINNDGIAPIPLTVHPLENPAGGVAASGDITPTVAATAPGEYYVKVNEIRTASFTITTTDSVASVIALIIAAVNAVLEMPVIASDGTTKVDIDCKWKGVTGNDLYLEVVGPTDLGVSFAFTQPTSGATNPTVDSALAQIGNVWESMLLNCLDIADTTALDAYKTWGDGRWDPDTNRFAVVFTGNTEATLATAITVPDARKTDRINSQLVAPGSKNLPFVVAARQLARIAKLANVTPAHDYGSQIADGLVPGTDAEQWTSSQKEAAVLGGSSTVNSIDGVIKIADVITMYHPSGDPLPPYRFVVDIVKLQQAAYNLENIFNSPEWDGAPLIPDDQATNEPTAKKPKTAKAAAAAMVDGLALKAILSAPEVTKPLISASISSSNPKRLDLIVPVFIAGNTNQKAISLQFAFYFGSSGA